jgi:AAA15 family ATPase/GTPase
MKLIERIELKYFRSFGEKNVKITDLKDLNIFSGSNDVGKSNVLRALNLFFNDEINIGERFDLKKDLSFLQRNRSQKMLESKKDTRTKDDPFASQRDLFVKVKIFFNRPITNVKSTTPEKFWVEKTWDKNGFNKQTSNIYTAYKKKNKRIPSQSQAGALLGQLTVFLKSINFEYIPAVKDRKFLQYLFKKLQKSLFERDNAFKETSNEINTRIAHTTGDLFKEFKAKTGIDAAFSIPESLIDFFTTINVSTENEVSLYSRGDGIQARFIPAILNEISKGKKHIIWGFEEPENSYEYRNAELLARDFLNTYSEHKQIFITSHTKEFLSLIKENEDRVSLHRVYKTLSKGSLVDRYKKGKGFNKKEIQKTFWEGNEGEKKQENKDILDKIFEDIGFLESDQYVIEDLQNQLKTQRRILEKSGFEFDKQERINKHLTKRLEDAILDKKTLEQKIEEYKKPILYVEDKYDQIYRIAFLKTIGIECNNENFEDLFKENALFNIHSGEGARKLAGRLRSHDHDGCEEKKIIGLFDFDREGREHFYHLQNEKFWPDDCSGNLKSGYFKKRSDHKCFYALLLPVPDELKHLASLIWPDFVSYVEIENLLSKSFLEEKQLVEKKECPAGKYLKVKENKKDKLWKILFDLPEEHFKNFSPLFERIMGLFTL